NCCTELDLQGQFDRTNKRIDELEEKLKESEESLLDSIDKLLNIVKLLENGSEAKELTEKVNALEQRIVKLERDADSVGDKLLSRLIRYLFLAALIGVVLWYFWDELTPAMITTITLSSIGFTMVETVSASTQIDTLFSVGNVYHQTSSMELQTTSASSIHLFDSITTYEKGRKEPYDTSKLDSLTQKVSASKNIASLIIIGGTDSLELKNGAFFNSNFDLATARAEHIESVIKEATSDSILIITLAKGAGSPSDSTKRRVDIYALMSGR
ncbi:MAG: hypothetical protein AAF391_13285, partial [Bacteroidota bacterium]